MGSLRYAIEGDKMIAQDRRKEIFQQHRASVVQNLGGSESNTLNAVFIGQLKKEPVVDKVGFFNKELTEDEEQVRDLAKQMDVHISEVERVREQFASFDADSSGRIDKAEFIRLLTELVCIGKAKDIELPTGMVNEYWKRMDNDRSGQVDFIEFCQWFFQVYKPEMERAMKHLGNKR